MERRALLVRGGWLLPPVRLRVEMTALQPWVGGAFDYLMTAVGAEQVASLAKHDMRQTARVSGRLVGMVRHRRLRIRFA